ncbi:SpoV family signaling peptide [Streptococcus pyogenes]|uniref:SpoV family signaling peptide n=1 Tax=Streptococcus pyogenes TaxID=1314 RepID=UPI00109D74F9|nr:SpoV family signaling peptide [Streptococcus pyogenes]VGQ57363.1 Uncharacterised protein [Streptococcus pyogenes]VGV40743.1 Uncharacterised protein [Streptococcus pyogenes]VHA63469.1 Uncharacterised protein [Streptococcus pyogenes]VHA78720.1 Uncharacterised protein [Streptococcus pyogenes]VHC51793.1 Uncharacterised protein [Streptococcus pyogenes]
MKKKLSLFMIATAAVVGLSLATPENQTVSANETTSTQKCDYSFYGYCGPLSYLFYETKYLFWGRPADTTLR